MTPHVTHSPQETFDLGCALGRALSGGETVALLGNLGAGKTQFVKGVAVGNGLDDPSRVTSPTFVLVNEYPGRLYLYHVDLYRLRGEDEVFSLGLDEMADFGSVVLIEWADRARNAMPSDTLWLEFELLGQTDRAIGFKATGPQAERALHALQEALR